MKDNNNIKNAWNDWSDNYYKENDDQDIIKSIIETPHKVFPTKVWEYLSFYYPKFEGVKVCVPSSGDNKAVFAFHLLGADVTSCDISHNQINNAKLIAKNNNWNINFKVLDSMDLSSIESELYDLVYTSNGVHVWISDLNKMYSSFNRILKNNGRYIFFETHPFIRPFDDNTNELKIVKRYDKIETGDEIPNYHWRVQDFVNSLIKNGFTIDSISEIYAEKDIIGATWWNDYEWNEKADMSINPYSALPQWISFCSYK